MTTGKSKPLGRKAYGSIGHLPNSRMGPGDHRVPDGMARIATQKPRDKHDLITVTEKLDGSCTAVANIDGRIVPLGRSGWTAESSPYEQHRMFANWVYERQQRFIDLLEPGERLVGEWLAQAHGTRYDLDGLQPWVVFDLIDRTNTRILYDDLLTRTQDTFSTPAVLAREPISVEQALSMLEQDEQHGFYGATEPVEGAVWRVERRAKFDFLCKFVRPDKQDGTYLPEVSQSDPVWNWSRPA